MAAMLNITAGELTAGLKALEAFPVADVKKAIGEKLANLADDAVVAEDVCAALNDIGVPYAGDVGLAIKALVWVAQNSKSPPNGGVIGAFMDSLEGITRPVVIS